MSDMILIPNINIPKSSTLDSSESCAKRRMILQTTSKTLAEVGPENLLYLHCFTSEWTTALSGIRKFDVFDWKVCTHHDPPTQPTPLRKLVWNIRESCGRPRSTHTLDFLTRWHCVRQTDVNSWKRDTCVRFMCCLLDDVWGCLKRF